jgi:hypothetical protein
VFTNGTIKSAEDFTTVAAYNSVQLAFIRGRVQLFSMECYVFAIAGRALHFIFSLCLFIGVYA